MALVAADAPHDFLRHTVKPLACGAFAGCVETVVCMPFETTKTRVQLQEGAGGGMLRNMASTVRSEGVRGLYFGMPIMLIQTAGKVGIRFLVYEQIKRLLQDETGRLSASGQVVAGTVAGAMEAILWITPCERLKTLRQTQIGVQQQVYTTWYSSLRLIAREQGLAGLWKGLTPTLLRNAMASGMRFVIYDYGMRSLQRLDSSQQRQAWHSVVCGAAVGAITTVFNNPLDVVKSLMQAEGAAGRAGYRGGLHCAACLVREGGPLALMRGLSPRLFKITIGQAVIFTVYDQCMRLLPH
eukprot:EG_transcript_15718